MAVTALQIIRRAMLLIQSLAAGETPTADEGADGLISLNQMLYSWQASGLNVPYFNELTATLSSGADPPQVTFGDTSDQPLAVHQVWIEESGKSYVLSRMTGDEYAALDKSLTGTRPSRWILFRADPLDLLVFDRIPSGDCDVHILGPRRFDTFSALSTTDQLPDDYLEAIEYNLAIRLAPMYERKPSAAVVAIAKSALKRLRMRNAAERIPGAVSDLAGDGYWDFTVGDYV